MSKREPKTKIIGSVRREPSKPVSVNRAFEPVRREIAEFRRETTAEPKSTP